MGRRNQFDTYKNIVVLTVKHIEQNYGHGATIQEIADAANISVASAHKYVKRLHTEGTLEWRPRAHRSIRLAPQKQ